MNKAQRPVSPAISTEYVSLPVPIDRVAEVYALLGRSPDAPPGPKAEPPAGPQADAVWTPVVDDDDDDVFPWTTSSLRRMYSESSGNMQKALDYLSERGGEDVSTNELARALGLLKGAASVAGMLGAFSRRCWNRYDRYVPWESTWRWTDQDAGTSETLIRMPQEVAAVLKSLRAR